MARRLVVVAALVVGASALGRVCTAHFRHPLTPAFVRRLEAVLGYEPRDYVPPSSLLLFVDDRIDEALRAHFAASLQSIECGDAASRCSPAIGHASAPSAPSLNTPVFLEPRLESSERVAVVAPSSTTTLRVLFHEGAYALGRTPADCHGAVESMLSGAERLRSLDRSLALVERVGAEPMSAAMRVAACACVCYVEPYVEVALANAWSVEATHNASVPERSLAEAGACGDSCEPLRALSLRGQGRIVSLSDTGVADSVCAFVDPGRAVPSVSGLSLPSVPADTGHRKFRARWAYQDAIDSDGHGTHVAGTLAGSARTRVDAASLDADDFDGGAPTARLVVVDLHRAGSSLVVPQPLDSQLLEFVRRAGATLHSASWGAADHAYSDLDRRVDSFLVANPNFVFVAAAGNDAEGGVLSPALGKNVLSVGASGVGADAFLAASGAVLVHERDAYARDWVADFSSSSSASSPVPWLTPLLVAPGDRFVWSANAFGRADGVCSPLADTIVGLAGTSMATPAVAEAVALVQQYFDDGRYASRSLVASGPLVIALLLGGAQPTRGRFPLRTFESLAADTSPLLAPYGRRRIEGHGRASVVDSLVTPRLLVLANYGSATTFTRGGELHRFCVEARGAPGATVSLRVVLGYYDRVTAAGASPRLVNDLDVAVVLDGRTYFPNGLAARDSRSNWERVDVNDYVLDADGRAPFSVAVRSATIGFGSQRYALVVLARGASALVYDRLGERVDPDAIDYGNSGTCTLCGDTWTRTCARCGNGVVESGEQCEAGACCANCALVADGRACTALVEGCALDGRCTGATAECNVSATSVLALAVPSIYYAACTTPAPTSAPTRAPTRAPTVPPAPGPTSSAAPSAPPTRAPTPKPTTRAPTAAPTSTPACSRSADQWAELLVNGTLASDIVLCCIDATTLASERLAGRSALTPALARLADELLAARLNFRAGVPASVLDLIVIDEAARLLEAMCDRRALTAATLDDAHSLVASLRAYSERTLCSFVVVPERCASDAEQSRANADYCNSAGDYSFDTARCRCAASRHDSRDDCSALHCSGNGASAPDADGVERCVCFDGWAGLTCSSCRAAPSQSTAYLCVGIDRAAATNVSHALVLVAASSVAARLDGTYYAPAIDKAPDARPNTGALDCSCASASRDHSSFDTHADAVEYALERWRQRIDAYALGAPRAATGETITPPPPPPPPPSSGAGRLRPFFAFW